VNVSGLSDIVAAILSYFVYTPYLKHIFGNLFAF